LLSRGEIIVLEHLPARVLIPAPASLPVVSDEPQPLEKIEQQAILQALKKHGFNRTETARALGISRRSLVYKLQTLRSLGFPVDGTDNE
jgi:DNA-binding NtrC family response regulator